MLELEQKNKKAGGRPQKEAREAAKERCLLSDFLGSQADYFNLSFLCSLMEVTVTLLLSSQWL